MGALVRDQAGTTCGRPGSVGRVGRNGFAVRPESVVRVKWDACTDLTCCRIPSTEAKSPWLHLSQ